jgi:hypothetical protein
MGEASDILAPRQIVHTVMRSDWPIFRRLVAAMLRCNLWSVCENDAGHGVERFLVARAIERFGELKTCRNAVAAIETVVCRLVAGIETMERRVRMRETGATQRDDVARVAKLNDILGRARLENFSIANEDRSPSDVALEMLVRAGGISS